MSDYSSTQSFPHVVAWLSPEARVIVGPSGSRYVLQLRRAAASGFFLWGGRRSRARLSDFLEAFGSDFPDLVTACAGLPENPAAALDLAYCRDPAAVVDLARSSVDHPDYCRVLVWDNNFRVVGSPDGASYVVQFVPHGPVCAHERERWSSLYSSSLASEVIDWLRRSVRCLSDYSGPVAPDLFAGCAGLPAHVRDCPLAALPSASV